MTGRNIGISNGTPVHCFASSRDNSNLQQHLGASAFRSEANRNDQTDNEFGTAAVTAQRQHELQRTGTYFGNRTAASERPRYDSESWRKCRRTVLRIDYVRCQ
jgi:hypothetical protein